LQLASLEWAPQNVAAQLLNDDLELPQRESPVQTSPPPRQLSYASRCEVHAP
jgi:hypothetical protein